jgi:hypothetical protein
MQCLIIKEKNHNSIQQVLDDVSIPLTYKGGCIIWNIL